MLKPIAARPAAPTHSSAAVAPKVIAKNAFARLYNANQNENTSKRPGWPYNSGEKVKLAAGAELGALGIDKLPRGSKAAHAINALIKQGIDGDQEAFTIKVGKETFTVVAAFPEDAARDEIWIFDAKGQNKIAHGTPNETTGKLVWD